LQLSLRQYFPATEEIMDSRIFKGTLVLVNHTEDLHKKVDIFGGAMKLFGCIVKEFHSKLMLTGADEEDGLCFMKKFTPEGWVDVCVEEGKNCTGLVPFPTCVLDVVDDEKFCENNLEDIVLIKRKMWFKKSFGNDLNTCPDKYECLKELYKFHGKVLRSDWSKTEKQRKGYRILNRFTTNGWEHIYMEKGKPESGYLLFPEEIMNDFDAEVFFRQVEH
jgi:hypothetical protein